MALFFISAFSVSLLSAFHLKSLDKYRSGQPNFFLEKQQIGIIRKKIDVDSSLPPLFIISCVALAKALRLL